MARPKKPQKTNVPLQLQLISPDEIGGELLNILSKGLYTNPLDAIREYVQNSIDANADEVEIQVTGNSVFIRDNGEGMSADVLMKARRFGVSSKSIEDNVGFRGIGIYSGFDLCNRLILRTKRKGDQEEHLLEFQFGDMRRILDEARQNPARPVIPLQNLLFTYVNRHAEPSDQQEASFTIVQLEDLSDDHIHLLSDIGEVRRYVLRNLPVKFNKEFIHSASIEQHLKDNVHGYQSARVVLYIESERVEIEKPNIDFVDTPRFGAIYDDNHNKIAYYWGCLTNGREAISTTNHEFEDFAGFIFKVKGFSIGDRGYMRSWFPKSQVYPWWTGEVYITSTHIIPTSARDDFEAGLARDEFERAVRDELRKLSKEAMQAQETRRAAYVIETCEHDLADIERQIDNADKSTYDEFKIYKELGDVIDKLEGQKSKATSSDKRKTVKLLANAKELQEIAKALNTSTESIADRKRQVVKAKVDAVNVGDSDSGGEKGKVDVKPTKPVELEETPRPRLLVQVVRELGWIIDSDSEKLIAVLGQVFADNLGTDSILYAQIISDIEDRLADLLESE